MIEATGTPTISLSRSLHLERYRKIVSVFARHGFGSFLANLHLERRISLPPGLLKSDPQIQKTAAERLRLALEELGPTFIKAGQILTTRPDLLGADYIKELSKLRDTVSPVSWEEIHPVLIEEWGEKLAQYFEQIEPNALAAASLAQVHLATLKTGEEVVVKIQRPGIYSIIQTDLEILRDLASLMQHTPWGQINNPEEIVEEFSISLRNELDYCREARNADRFRKNFSGDESIYIPEIYWDYTTRRVLVMERIQGIRMDDIAALDAAGYDRKKVALNAANLIVKEVLQDGFFHADPHAGNYIVMPGEVIGAMDFGLVGELTDRDRKRLSRLYVYAISWDTDGMIDELHTMGAIRSGTNRLRLARDLERLLGKYDGRPLKDIHAQEVHDEVTALCSRHRISIPANLWLLAKTLAMIEGLGLQLDPDFDFFAVSKPYVRQLKRQSWRPNSGWRKALLRQGTDWVEFLNLLPRAGKRVLEKTERGEWFEVGLKDMDVMLKCLSRLVNRLSLSIIIAGMVVALAILIAVSAAGSPLQILVVIGFLGTVGLGFWLLISFVKGIS